MLAMRDDFVKLEKRYCWFEEDPREPCYTWRASFGRKQHTSTCAREEEQARGEVSTKGILRPATSGSNIGAIAKGAQHYTSFKPAQMNEEFVASRDRRNLFLGKCSSRNVEQRLLVDTVVVWVDARAGRLKRACRLQSTRSSNYLSINI